MPLGADLRFAGGGVPGSALRDRRRIEMRKAGRQEIRNDCKADRTPSFPTFLLSSFTQPFLPFHPLVTNALRGSAHPKARSAHCIEAGASTSGFVMPLVPQSRDPLPMRGVPGAAIRTRRRMIRKAGNAELLQSSSGSFFPAFLIHSVIHAFLTSTQVIRRGEPQITQMRADMNLCNPRPSAQSVIKKTSSG
jgi:hypothetical protein